MIMPRTTSIKLLFAYAASFSACFPCAWSLDMASTEAEGVDNQKQEEGYVIVRSTDIIDPDNIVFEPQKRGDTIRIKYKVGGKAKILYLQSAPSYVRTPLLVDGTLQSTVDFDLCESASTANMEFAKKVRAIEKKAKEYLSKAGGDDADVYDPDSLLKSSLRVLTKTHRKRIPAFRVSTNSFNTKAIFGEIDPAEPDVAEDARVLFIAELFGMKSIKKNGVSVLLWRLSQMKVTKEKTEEKTDGNVLGVEDAFGDDDD